MADLLPVKRWGCWLDLTRHKFIGSSQFTFDHNKTQQMTLNEYQSAAVKTALPNAMSLYYLIPGLAAEAGEVCGRYAKWIRDNDESNLEKLEDELGDVLWFVALSAQERGLTLDDLAQRNINKLQSRQQRGVLGGSGDNR